MINLYLRGEERVGWWRCRAHLHLGARTSYSDITLRSCGSKRCLRFQAYSTSILIKFGCRLVEIKEQCRRVNDQQSVDRVEL